jgi:hypothetical protein
MRIFFIIGFIIHLAQSFIPTNRFLEYLVDGFIPKSIKSTRKGDEIPINLNVSDYTTNSLLSVTNNLLKLNTTLYNDTALPITLDTQGLQVLIPELSEYQTNTNMSLFIYRDPRIHQKITIQTIITSYVTLSFGLNFSVFDNTTMTYDDIIDCTLYVSVKFQLSPENNIINLLINKIDVNEVDLLRDDLGINVETFKENLNMVIELARAQIIKFTKFDIIGYIKQQGGGEYEQLTLDQQAGYIEFNLK